MSWRDLNLTLYRGEVVGLFGLMGSGRTELVRMIFGLDTFEQGEIVLGSSLGSAAYPQGKYPPGSGISYRRPEN